MLNKQYTIGEFATINKVTPRMLRHYDKIGIFKPSDTLSNGYRTYSSEQIPMICKIKKYQQCGFSLAEIKTLLTSTEEQIKFLAQEKKEVFNQEDDEKSDIWENLCILSGEVSLSFENHYEISFLEKNEQILFHKLDSVSEDDIESSFDSIYDMLEYRNIKPSGLMVLLNAMEQGCLYNPAVPIKDYLQQKDYMCTVIPLGKYLSTIHYGDYDSIGNGYDRLLCYAKEHGFIADKTFIERYFVDSTHTAKTSEYITEISLKITP